MDKSPELLKLQEGIDLDCKTKSMITQVNGFEQEQQEAYNKGKADGRMEVIERYCDIVHNFRTMTERMEKVVEISQEQASYISKSINESTNDTKLINVLLDAISCPVCPCTIDGNPCIAESNSLQCRELKRKYFEGRGEE